MRNILAGCLSIVTAAACAAQDVIPWTQLSLSSSKVDAYRRQHPTHDGRGIVVAVLDTGVDMDVPGLQTTTTGEMKVIDVQDFTGEGDVELSRATWNDAGDRLVHYSADGSPELHVPPVEEQRPAGTSLWFGRLEEKAFRNSAVADVNDNGRKDDVFAVCVVSRDDGSDDDAVCFIDTDADRDFSNERPLKNYRLAHDRFTFPREKKEKQIEPITCAVNIFVRQRRLSVHFDSGGHGTHVAGIAAGHRILGQDGFDGVAPGAKVISLKIGHSSLSGGATTTGAKQKAFEYAARYAREHDVTVVCNLSYGIGSIHEGRHHVDTFLDGLMRANPHLMVCTSAGNNGPGLSSIGTPAGATSAISVAALLAVDTAKDVRGEAIPRPQLTQFSSRGGELAKPTLAAPGMMTSTVPRWERSHDFWQGTSMASPYAAGLCAVLAQRAREKGVAPRADWIAQALAASAAPIEGYTTLDYGAGLPDLPRAGAILDGLLKSRAHDILYGFDVSTESPLGVGGRSPAAYWRTPYVPADRPQVFSVKSVLVPTADATAVTAFARRLTLHSDAAWCRPAQDQIYFRSQQSADLRVNYDAARLTEPGLYVATVTGMDGDVPLLRLVNSVVVPHRVGAAIGYRVRFDNQSVYGWVVRRHFIDVPAGASAMHMTLKSVEGKLGAAHAYRLHRPDGRYLPGRSPVRIDTRNGIHETRYTVRKELEPGIWEIPITSVSAQDESHYSLEVRFDGVHVSPAEVGSLKSEPGALPSGHVKFTNLFDRPAGVSFEGSLDGYRTTLKKKLTTGKDREEISLPMTPELKAVRVHVKLSDEDYAKLTDCAVNILDAAGKAIAQDGLGEPELTVSANHPEPGGTTTCKLEIQPAFTWKDADDAVEFDLTVDYLYADPIAISVTHGDAASAVLYPGVPVWVDWKLAKKPPAAPEGLRRFGAIRAVERESKAAVAEAEIIEKD